MSEAFIALAQKVLADHAWCVPSVEVHPDRSGTLHYDCGISVGPVSDGLAAALRTHWAMAIDAAMAGASDD